MEQVYTEQKQCRYEKNGVRCKQIASIGGYCILHHKLLFCEDNRK
jgi:hypothetical protein